MVLSLIKLFSEGIDDIAFVLLGEGLASSSNMVFV